MQIDRKRTAREEKSLFNEIIDFHLERRRRNGQSGAVSRSTVGAGMDDEDGEKDDGPGMDG